jgi:hypothetical protein
MSLDWSFGDHNARVQEGARNATLVDQNGAWHLRIKYDPPIIAGEHWDVLIEGPLPIKQQPLSHYCGGIKKCRTRTKLQALRHETAKVVYIPQVLSCVV